MHRYFHSVYSRFSGIVSALTLCSCIIIAMSGFTACSSDEPDGSVQEEIDPADQQFEANIVKINDALQSHAITDAASAKVFCTTLEGFTGANEPDEDFVSLYFDGDREYFIDFKGSSILQDGDDGSADDFNPSSYLDEMDEILGWEASTAATPQQPTIASRSDGAGDDDLLTKHNVLLWAPFHDDFPDLTMGISALQRSIRQKGRQMDVTYAYMGTNNITNVHQLLSYLKNMDDYDVVFIATHGDVYGRLIIPNDGSMPPMHLPEGQIWNKKTQRFEKTYALTHDWCTRYLPAKLSRTIVWTCVCNVFRTNGAFKEYCAKAKAADFYGTDQVCCVKISLPRFEKFYANFSSGTPSHRAYSWSRSAEFYDGVSASDHTGYTGYWRMASEYFSLSYARSIPSQIKDVVAGKFAFVTGKLAEILSHSSRAAASDVTIGFAIRRQGESNEQLIPLSEDVVDADLVSQKSYNDVICVDLALKAGTLPGGTYTYRTYIDYGNGTIDYSPNTRTVTLSDPVICMRYIFEGQGTYKTEQWYYDEYYGICGEGNVSDNFVVYENLPDSIYYFRPHFNHIRDQIIEIGSEGEYSTPPLFYASWLYPDAKAYYTSQITDDKKIRIEFTFSKSDPDGSYYECSYVYEIDMRTTKAKRLYKFTLSAHANLTKETGEIIFDTVSKLVARDDWMDEAWPR